MPAKGSAIAIVDYGMGNLSSVQKALKHLGAQASIVRSPSAIRKASKILIPGVGAFGDAMSELRKQKLLKPLQEAAAEGKKIFGVCLGLQLFFESSEESRGSKGLAFLPGKVRRFRTRKAKVPHMGWNQLGKIKKHPLLNGIGEKDFFYFVHSYYPVPAAKYQLAQSKHGGESFTAVAGRDNLFAVQFHPEKSQEPGLRMLKNFIRW